MKTLEIRIACSARKYMSIIVITIKSRRHHEESVTLKETLASISCMRLHQRLSNLEQQWNVSSLGNSVCKLYLPLPSCLRSLDVSKHSRTMPATSDEPFVSHYSHTNKHKRNLLSCAG